METITVWVEVTKMKPVTRQECVSISDCRACYYWNDSCHHPDHLKAIKD